ncbi:hypothetical protein VWY03_00365, partial [Phaeobacter sp. JH20_09]
KKNAIVNGQTDTVTDFELGTDLIEMTSDDYAGATIEDGASGAEIALDGYTILLEGVSASSLSDSDFSLV